MLLKILLFLENSRESIIDKKPPTISMLLSILALSKTHTENSNTLKINRFFISLLILKGIGHPSNGYS